MGWSNIVGHDAIRDRFITSHRGNRLANTYLFVGPEGIGKRLFALTLAKALLCETNTISLEACENCPGCVQVENKSHPDLILVSKPADKNFIPVESFIGDREHRRRQGLCHDISLTPFKGKRKIAIIDDADFLNAESANSLLKTLEEPPPNSIVILIGTSEHRQLPTIVSRAQVIRFQRHEPSELLEILSKLERPGEIAIERLAYASSGSVQRARLLDNKELFDFRLDFFSRLSTMDPAEGGTAKTLTDFVDSQTKEASTKRAYQKTLGDFAIVFFEGVIQLFLRPEQAAGLDPAVIDYAGRFIGNETKSQTSLEVLAANCIERTIMFQQQVDQNLAMANTIPSWLNDLGRLARGEKAPQFDASQIF